MELTKGEIVKSYVVCLSILWSKLICKSLSLASVQYCVLKLTPSEDVKVDQRFENQGRKNAWDGLKTSREIKV